MISVIIPNYNHAPYLKRRIESILTQTYQDFELILLDDCSTDDSAVILNSYKSHPKVTQVVINDINSGSPFKQWNKGFELAKGEYIWIAESDDWCEATLLETLVNPLQNNETLVMAICQSLLVDDCGLILYRTSTNKVEQIFDGKEYVTKNLFGDTNIVNAGMVVFRKSILDRIDDQYMKLKGAGDWMFWAQIALKGDIFVSCKNLNYCFRHNETVTSKSECSGQDFDEGNIVFNYVLKEINPIFDDFHVALKQRVMIYFNQRDKYYSKDIRQSSLKKLMSLHPLARRIYIKMVIKMFLKKLF